MLLLDNLKPIAHMQKVVATSNKICYTIFTEIANFCKKVNGGLL